MVAGTVEVKGPAQNGKMVNELLEFVNVAERNGNYPPNTAGGMKAAIRAVSPVLTEQEASSLDTFREHLDPIFQRVFNKNKSRLSPISLGVYRRRIHTALSDYEQYGRNPQAMASWNRKVRTVRTRRSSQEPSQLGGGESKLAGQHEVAQGGRALNRHELSLPNAKAILLDRKSVV